MTTATVAALATPEASVPSLHHVSRAPLFPRLQHAVEAVAAAVLAVDVLVVFTSVIFRYFLHDPLEWSEEVARALMVTLVFIGAAAALGRSRHVGMDYIRGILPAASQPYFIRGCDWIIAVVACGLTWTSLLLLTESTTRRRRPVCPQAIFVTPVLVGSVLLAVFGFANALSKLDRPALVSGVIVAVGLVAMLAINTWMPALAFAPINVMLVAFVVCLAGGVPIAFALCFGALLFFLSSSRACPSSSTRSRSRRASIISCCSAVPFFVLAGLIMEVNGMSSRLIELLLRWFGRLRGGLNLIMVVAMAFFSGISGSKLADVAAVGGILMPAVRKTRQDPNEATGLLAATAIMAETIPPCVNMIILGFVASLSIGGLFLAGIVPAIVMAGALAVVAVWRGRKVDVSTVFTHPRPMLKLIGGALVGVVMILMIGKGSFPASRRRRKFPRSP